MENKSKYIFVTGGVLSGLGKGVSAAALGNLLKARGYKVFVQKFDPYLNVDPGTMNPYQHGEVYVTEDGAETDLDLGHYERFIGENFTKHSNYVQGKLMLELLEEERAGVYQGATVQVIPHVTNKIIEKIEKAGVSSQADFVITEIGGTVGDIESNPFISAISQFSRLHPGSSFFMHATYVPYLEASEEFKSKPTQNAIQQLNSMGIIPNMVLLRANREIPVSVVKKVAHKAFMNENACIPVPNSDNIYKVPLLFEAYNMAQIVLNHFGLEDREADLTKWKEFVSLIDAPKSRELRIAMVGKYVEYEDAYKSIVEATKIAALWNQTSIKLDWIQSEGLHEENIDEKLRKADGVMILPGFGKRGFDGKVVAARYTRENDIPTFGICYGMQAMTVVQAQNKGFADATTSEVSEEGTFVIDVIRGTEKDADLGGTLRLGAQKTLHKKGSLLESIYGSDHSIERHRHRFEVNPKYVSKLEDDEFIFSGEDAVNGLKEVCEVPSLKFYVGLQAHPEFNAKPMNNHPVFDAFIKATIEANN